MISGYVRILRVHNGIVSMMGMGQGDRGLPRYLYASSISERESTSGKTFTSDAT